MTKESSLDAALKELLEIENDISDIGDMMLRNSAEDAARLEDIRRQIEKLEALAEELQFKIERADLELLDDLGEANALRASVEAKVKREARKLASDKSTQNYKYGGYSVVVSKASVQTIVDSKGLLDYSPGLRGMDVDGALLVEETINVDVLSMLVSLGVLAESKVSPFLREAVVRAPAVRIKRKQS